MKLYFSGLFLFVTLVSYALPPAGDEGYKVFFTWSSDRKLKWDDFQGTPYANAAEVAMTASSVEFNYHTRGNEIGWTVTAKYFPKLSWSNKQLQSDIILKHEQVHFDITELYARMFRKQLQENVHSTADIPTLKAIGKNIMKQWSQEENRYDQETNHSVNTAQQLKWEKDIQQRLDSLQEFASK